MQLVRKPQIIGHKIHRCGWPYVVNSMKKLDTGAGIVCDDFIEQTFCHGIPTPQILREHPWVAITHVPPKAVPPFSGPGFVDYDSCIPGGAEAMQNLRGLCTMSHHMADRFRQVCDIPVHVIHYPTNTDVRQFDLQQYLRMPQLIHLGWFFKNLLLLEHIPPTPHILQKTYVRAQFPMTLETKIRKHCATRYSHRTRYKDVKYMKRMTDSVYDVLLSQAVIAVEFVECGAATVIVEALARCTPILVNRHPALIEYLGSDYPMFFDDVKECPDLLHPANVAKTYEYITAMDKSFLKIDNFTQQFSKWIAYHEQQL